MRRRTRRPSPATLRRTSVPMDRKPWIRLLVASLVVASWAAPAAVAQRAKTKAAPRAASESADGDEDRDRNVMERFLSILEKTPKRGTALDRVYGYHVERGSLDRFIKTYQDRTAKDPKDGNAWMLLGL